MKVLHGSAKRINHAEAAPGQMLRVMLPVKFSKEMNPLKKGLLITLGVIVALIIVVGMFAHRRSFGSSARKSVCVSDSAKHIIFGPKTIRLGGCSEVVFSSKEVKQGLIDRFFRGKTACVTNAVFITPLILKPGRGRRDIKLSGKGYVFSSSTMKYTDTAVTASNHATKTVVEFS